VRVQRAGSEALSSSLEAGGLAEKIALLGSVAGEGQGAGAVDSSSSSRSSAATAAVSAAMTSFGAGAASSVAATSLSASSPSPSSPSSLALGDGDGCPRCPASGLLILSQHDVHRFVFAPLAYARAVQARVMCDVLTEYLGSLKKWRVPVACAATPALLVHLLSRCGRLSELVQLVHYKLIPDSPLVALALLNASDLGAARAHRQAQRLLRRALKANANTANAAAAEAMTKLAHAASKPSWACSTVEQLALDCLWRQGESVAVVLRMLNSGKFSDAARLCLGCLRGSLHATHPAAARQLLASRGRQTSQRQRRHNQSNHSSNGCLPGADMARSEATAASLSSSSFGSAPSPSTKLPAKLFLAAAYAEVSRIPYDDANSCQRQQHGGAGGSAPPPSPSSSAAAEAGASTNNTVEEAEEAAAAIRQQQQQQQSNGAVGSSLRRTAVFNFLVAFLRAWDPGALVRVGSLPGGSPPPSSSPFSSSSSSSSSSQNSVALIAFGSFLLGVAFARALRSFEGRLLALRASLRVVTS